MFDGSNLPYHALTAFSVTICALGAVASFRALRRSRRIEPKRSQQRMRMSGGGAWGLSQMEDQQLGGLIMWVPCCAIRLGAAIAVFAGLLRDAEVRAERSPS